VSPPLTRTSRGHLVTTDELGRVVLFLNRASRLPVALTPDDLGEDAIVQRLNATEAAQAERYARDAFLWEKRRHRRDPRKDTP
jgi:hypothetical protein